MDILMPQLGETVAEGKITKWFKAANDAIKAGDELFEIETDKVSMEVPATAAGTLSEIRVPAGAVAPVGAVVAVLSGAEEARAPVRAEPSAAVPPGLPEGSETPAARATVPLDPFREVRTPDRNFGPAKDAKGRTATPLARRMAGLRTIDLAKVVASGPHGRLVAADVEKAIASSSLTEAFSMISQVAPSESPFEKFKASFAETAFEEVPLDGMRKTIASRLVEAKQTVPHFYLTADVELDALLKLREQINGDAPKDRDGKPAYKISVNDFVIKGMALALQRVPSANAVWAGDRILRFKHSDVGVAVAIEGGLLTPVIRQAETKSLSTISLEMKSLAARARDRKLKPEEYKGGTSAISNLGMFGIRQFSAIINPPHASILAVGAARRAPVEAADCGIRFVSQMTVTLSCDHRVIDGALGAELLMQFQHLLQAPLSVVV